MSAPPGRSAPNGPGAHRGGRDCRSTTAGTAPATGPARRSAPGPRRTRAVARPGAPAPARPRAAPAGAWRPAAASAAAARRARSPSCPAPAAHRAALAGSDPPTRPRSVRSQRLICPGTYIPVKACRSAALLDVLDGAVSEDGARLGRDRVAPGVRLAVLEFDHQSVAVAARPRQRPPTVELHPVQPHLEVPVIDGLRHVPLGAVGVRQGVVHTGVPDDHRAAAVLAGGDQALERR